MKGFKQHPKMSHGGHYCWGGKVMKKAEGGDVKVLKAKKIMVIIEAIKAIFALSCNFCFISASCDITAAMVVSDIIDRLSPNIAPPTTVAVHNGVEMPSCWLNAKPIGAIVAIVPMEVPMLVETKAETRNSPISKN